MTADSAELDRLAELSAAATPGPWRVGRPLFRCRLDHEHGPGGCRYSFAGWSDDPTAVSQDAGHTTYSVAGGGPPPVCGQWDYDEGGVFDPVDAAFIAAAANYVRGLLAAARGGRAARAARRLPARLPAAAAVPGRRRGAGGGGRDGVRGCRVNARVVVQENGVVRLELDAATVADRALLERLRRQAGSADRDCRLVGFWAYHGCGDACPPGDPASLAFDFGVPAEVAGEVVPAGAVAVNGRPVAPVWHAGDGRELRYSWRSRPQPLPGAPIEPAFPFPGGFHVYDRLAWSRF
jgi:hypothetical protein